MDTYELMLVLRLDFNYGDAKACEDLVTKLVDSSDLVAKEVKILGKKALAYPVNKQKEGVYVQATIEGPLSVAKLAKKARQDDVVLRYLVTKK